MVNIAFGKLIKLVEIWHLVYFNTGLVQNLGHTNVFLELWAQLFQKKFGTHQLAIKLKGILVIFIGELTKIGHSDALLLEIKAKIAHPVVKTFFWGQGNYWANNADSRLKTFFFEAEGSRAIVQQRWSSEQWAMQTSEKQKMGHGSKKVENHCSRFSQYTPVATFFVRNNFSVEFKPFSLQNTGSSWLATVGPTTVWIYEIFLFTYSL